MSDFSLEPSRTNLLFHQTFDYYDEANGRYVDISPQANDATVVGGDVRTTTGVIGQAAVLGEREELSVNSIDTTRQYDELFESAWSTSEDPIASGDTNVTFGVSFSSEPDVVLTHTVNEDVTDWQFATGRVYEDSDDDTTVVELYYARLGDPEPTMVARTDTGHTEAVDGSYALTFETSGETYLDDVRIYDGGKDERAIENVYAIGNEHQSVEEYGEHWPTDGLPYITGVGNANFAGTLGETDDVANRTLDAVHEAQHIETAAGTQLDRIGAHAGVKRRTDESDAHYRARIKAVRIAGRSDGSFEDVLDAAASIVETSRDDIDIFEPHDGRPGTVVVSIPQTVIGDTTLTAIEVETLLEDAVPVGHRVIVTVKKEYPFTLVAKGEANDPRYGLTSTSTSTGGYLVKRA